MADRRGVRQQAKPAPKKQPMAVAPARLAAFHVLLEMDRSRSAHSDELLHGAEVEELSQRDRNLAMTLVMGVLRWQLALDGVIRERLRRTTALDAEVAIALRLGTYQVLLLDRIPVHAAIHDSVELAKRAGHRFAAGLVNAVLRKLAADKPTALDPLTAHPAWMVERWRAQFGDDATAVLCAYDQQTPRSTLRLSSDVAAEGGVARGEFLTRAGVLGEVSGDGIAGTTVVEQRFQDEGSQLIAELAGEGTRILDCCAAPGGKTAILAERNPAAHITAGDISRGRLDQMRRNFAGDPATARIECEEMDAADPEAMAQKYGGQFDLVLCDAPCTGTGTLARNPEIKLRLQAADLERQQQRQVRILASVVRCLKPQGRLIYSTCSLEPEENEDVVRRCLEGESAMRLQPMAERLDALERSGAVHAEGVARLREHALRGDFLQTLPGPLRCDGFFAAVFTRV